MARNRTGDGEASIPKSIYRAPGQITESLDIDFNDSQLIGKTLGKGSIVVRPTAGPVTLRNFRVAGGQGAVRDESDGELRIIGAQADRTLEGLLLSGNGGTGVYEIVDSTVTAGRAYNDTNRGSRHNVYIGVSESATFDNFKSLGHVYYGHLLKSRSTDLTVVNSTLDGLDTRHSRAIDWNPEGNGTLLIDNTSITVSEFADNIDFIGICREASCYNNVTDLTVKIRDSIFICNRSAPCNFSVGPGLAVTWDIDQATRDASQNILWIDNGTISDKPDDGGGDNPGNGGGGDGGDGGGDTPGNGGGGGGDGGGGDGSVRGNLILDGMWVFETENGVLKEKFTAASNTDVTVGRHALLKLFFDRLPAEIDIDELFEIDGKIIYDPVFGPDNIVIYVEDSSMAGTIVPLRFQTSGNAVPRMLEIVAKGAGIISSPVPVPAPATAIILIAGLVGMGIMRRRYRSL